MRLMTEMGLTSPRQQDDHCAVLRGQVPGPERQPVVAEVGDFLCVLDAHIGWGDSRLHASGVGEGVGI